MQRKLATLLLAGTMAVPTFAQDMPSPGMWKVEGKTTGVDLASPSGVPAAMTDMIRNRIMSRPAQDHSQCVTAEDFASAPERLVKSSESRCEYERFDLSGGRIDAVAACDFPQGGSGRMEMSGSYSTDRYEATSVLTVQAGPLGAMTITTETTGTRVGPCS